jgi:phage major head subunit gpT-like protein
MISGNVPNHLVVAARTGFLTTALPATPTYAPIATMLMMDSKNQVLVDLGGAPMPLRNRGKHQTQDFIEKSLTVTPLDWDITVFLSHNALKDDRTGDLDRKVRAAGANFQRHISQQAFKALNDGDATTNFGACYDTLAFYSASHVDNGGAYQTVQSNLGGALALSLDNLETVMVQAKTLMDDQGEYTDYNYDLLVVPPAYQRIAANICRNNEAYDTANRELNPYQGMMKYIVSPKLDSTAWVLAASSETIKPIIIVMREAPNLQSAWFDPEAEDGGRYYFKFYARYNHYYGDWRTALLGHT